MVYKIDDFSRELVIERYVEDIVSGLHFLDLKERLKCSLLRDKRHLSNDQLEIEIERHDPGLLKDLYIEEMTAVIDHEKKEEYHAATI